MLILARYVTGTSIIKASDVASLVLNKFVNVTYRYEGDVNPKISYTIPKAEVSKIAWLISCGDDPIISRLIDLIISSCHGDMFEKTARTEKAVLLLAKYSHKLCKPYNFSD